MGKKLVTTVSSETIKVLQNFATINNSLAFKKGTELKTLLPGGGIYASAKNLDDFPIDFPIYDLSKLLRVLSLPFLEDCEWIFEEGKKFVLLKKDNNKIKYHFTTEAFVEPPDGKAINLPSVDFSFDLTKEMLEQVLKSASILKHTKLITKIEKGEVSISGVDPDSDTSDSYIIKLDDVDGVDDNEFILDISNMKMIHDMYKVEFCKAGIVKFTSEDGNLEYFVGLCKV